ncbi:MAG: C1 family peptidase [Minicystis sp.]
MRVLTIPFLALLVAGLGACAGASTPAQGPGWGQQQGYSNNPGQWTPMSPQGPGQMQQPPMWLPPIYRPVNVGALLALQGRIPCAPREVAPGTWATFDCAPFQAVQRVLQYVPMVRYNFLPTGPVPAAVDHRAEGSEGPVKDQGAVGSCTAVSLSTAMDNAVRRMGRQDVISALHVWSNYGIGVMGRAGDSNLDKSLTVENVWQYDPVKACKLVRTPMDSCTTAYGVASGSESFDPALKAEHVNADANGKYKLAGLEQLRAKPADPGEMAGVLAAGDDVWISFSVNDQAWMSRSLTNGVIPDYDVTEDVGHAVVLAGYRTMPNGTKQFLVHNSWSNRWGENGYGWISEAMVARHTRAAYRVRVTDGAGNGVPSLPGQAPAGGACPAGQAKDPIFGMCVPSGIPGLPGVPGGQQPAPGGQQPAPAQPQKQGSCPQGQAPDVMSGQCNNVCAGGAPSVGGMCLPGLPR